MGWGGGCKRAPPLLPIDLKQNKSKKKDKKLIRYLHVSVHRVLTMGRGCPLPAGEGGNPPAFAKDFLFFLLWWGGGRIKHTVYSCAYTSNLHTKKPLT